MMKKYFIYSFILLVGFLFNPSNSYACGSKSVKTEKECCKKNTSDKKCCSENKSGSKEKGCKGKCGHSNCTTTSGQGSMTFFNDLLFDTQIIEISSKEISFNYTKFNPSSGYVSLWLIPKIS